MTRNSVLCCLSTILILAISQSARADQCDPNAILRSNIATYQNNISVFLASQNVYNKDINAGHKAAAGFVYDGFPISANDAGTFSQTIHQMTSYSLKDDESTSILLMTLDQGSVKAYIACLGNENQKPILITAPQQALTDAAFPLVVHWRPDYRAPPHAKVTISVTNGTIHGLPKASFDIQPSDQIPVDIVRDNAGAKSLIVTAWAYGKASDFFTVPPLPDFEVNLQQKFSGNVSLCRSGGCGISYVSSSVTIVPDGDSRLLPDSLSFIGQTSGDVKDVWACPDPHPEINPHRCDDYHASLNDPLHVVGEIRGRSGANEQENKITGQFRVLQVVVTPKSDRKQSPLKAVDPVARDAHPMRDSTYIDSRYPLD